MEKGKMVLCGAMQGDDRQLQKEGVQCRWLPAQDATHMARFAENARKSPSRLGNQEAQSAPERRANATSSTKMREIGISRMPYGG